MDWIQTVTGAFLALRSYKINSIICELPEYEINQLEHVQNKAAWIVVSEKSYHIVTLNQDIMLLNLVAKGLL